MDKPRTFDHFPAEKVCPFCGTSEDAECVLLGIDGTTEDGIEQGLPVHLWCAVAQRYNPDIQIAYRRARVWKGRIINPTEVKRQYCTPDQSMINDTVQRYMKIVKNATPEQIKTLEAIMGGVEVYLDEGFAGRVK